MPGAARGAMPTGEGGRAAAKPALACPAVRRRGGREGAVQLEEAMEQRKALRDARVRRGSDAGWLARVRAL